MTTSQLPALTSDITELRHGREAEWIDEGACANHPNPEWWFPQRGVTPSEAIAICAGCNVRLACLRLGIQNIRYPGVWGGRSRNERRQIAIALTTQ